MHTEYSVNLNSLCHILSAGSAVLQCTIFLETVSVSDWVTVKQTVWKMSQCPPVRLTEIKKIDTSTVGYLHTMEGSLYEIGK